MTYWLTNYDLTGNMPIKVGSGWPPFCPYQVFTTANDMIFVGVNNESSWAGFLKVLGLERLADDERFKSNSLRVENKKSLLELVEPVIAGRNGRELVEKLSLARVAAGPLNEIDKVVSDPHLTERGLITNMKYENIESYKTVGIPFKMSDTPGAMILDPPTPGNATDEVLRSIGYDAKGVEDLRRQGIVK